VNRSDFNPLQRELARGRQVEPHPDPDILTALSEGALSQRERQQVLAHLAACADCREALSVAAAAALDSADDLQPFLLARPAHPAQRTWLPWASVAASLLVLCSAALFYQQKLALPKNETAATKEAAPLPLPTRQQPPPPMERKETLGKKTFSQRQSQLQPPLPSQSTAVAKAIPEAPILAVNNSEYSQQNSYQAHAQADDRPMPGILEKNAAPTRSVSAFDHAAPERALSSASISAAARAHWRINSLGQPERSFGDGEWQAVLPYEQTRMRVISVFGGEVWIGGDSSRLYHSSDNGTNWKLVALPDKDGREHSIAHIHFQTAESGTVASDDGIVWITSNGGDTWK
jgi:hypothetical protein